jgi:hypothetical protein
MRCNDSDLGLIRKQQRAIKKRWLNSNGLKSVMPIDTTMYSNANPIIKLNREIDVKNGTFYKLAESVKAKKENINNIDVYGRIYATAYSID